MSSFQPRRLPRLGLLFPVLSLCLVITGWGLVSRRISQRRAADAKYFVLKQERSDYKKPNLSVVTADGGSPDPVNSFGVKLLQLVLDKSRHPYTLTVLNRSFSQDNLVRALRTSEKIPHNAIERVNVAILGADSEINKSLRRIPIPITGGLLGMRVGFTHKQFLPLTSMIKDVQDLDSLSLVQGVGWRDVEILDASGLNTYTARPNQLLQITASGQAHLFLRGISELENELMTARRVSSELVLDPSLIVIYPFAGFFYVNPGNMYLARALEQGFREAITDGSYQRLLSEELFKPSLRSRLRLKGRTVIFLDNPDVNASLSGVDRNLWLVPWNDLANGSIATGQQLCSLDSLALLCEDGVNWRSRRFGGLLKRPNTYGQPIDHTE